MLIYGWLWQDDDADTVEDQVILCSQKLVIDVIERYAILLLYVLFIYLFI